jgi:hypothetical protein
MTKDLSFTFGLLPYLANDDCHFLYIFLNNSFFGEFSHCGYKRVGKFCTLFYSVNLKKLAKNLEEFAKVSKLQN